MTAPLRGKPAGELGYSLIELVVLVAIIAIGAGAAFETLAQGPAAARSTAVRFAGLVAEARTLAAVTGDGTSLGDTGATIGVVRDGDEYIATLYAGRPIQGQLHPPVAARNAPPLQATTALGLVVGNALLEPPFALFVSASGHVSAQAPFTVNVDAPLAEEPACAIETGIVIAFIDAVQTTAHAISCEMARLDLDTAYPLVSR